MASAEYLVGPRFDLSEKISKKAGIELVEVENRVFSDGETCPKLSGRLEKLKGAKIFLINELSHGTFDVNCYLLQYFFLAKALKEAGTGEIELIMPYFPYARQDKVFRKGETFTLKYIAELFSSLGIKTIHSVSTHFERDKEETELGGLKVHNLSGYSSLAGSLSLEEKPVVVAPDFGSSYEVRQLAETISSDFVSFDKRRDKDTGRLTMEGDSEKLSGKIVLIADDMIASGGTMLKAVDLIAKAGPKKIYCLAVHGLFTKGAVEKFREIHAETITTNTIANPFSRADVSGIIAEAIRN